ncbi:MAG: PD-(D/E)XK nuclease family protein [Hyphomicrobiales bacterium]
MSKAAIQEIEEMLVGSGKLDFDEFEKHLNYFCPFEAIGMVRQEIRHAHFLCFLLDPNQSHPFGDLFLRTLLSEVASQFTITPPFKLMDLHFMNATNVIVYRERWNIDILVEIPKNSFDYLDKGLVFVIELKIDASESQDQLAKYRDRILKEYDEDEWLFCFAFLTPDTAEPSSKNAAYWTPVSLLETLSSFDASIEAKSITGRAFELYKDYRTMVQKHLEEDTELVELAKRIWSKHRKALETLLDYRPDKQAEIIDWIRQNPAETIGIVEGESNITLQPDTHGPRILRYVVKDWLEIDGFNSGDKNWVESASLLVVEITDWGQGRIRASFVLGPSADQDLRERIYSLAKLSHKNNEIKINRLTADPKGKYKHLSAIDIQTKEIYLKGEDEDISAEILAKDALKKFALFLSKDVLVYDQIIRKTLLK